MHVPSLPITTARLTLRPFVDTDLDDLYAYQSLPEVATYLYWDARDRGEAVASLATKVASGKLVADDDSFVLAAELAGAAPGGGRVIGEVSLKLLSIAHRQGEFGFTFNPQFHGRGYASEAAHEMLRIGFESVGLHRIVGRCDARNGASARLMERLGMRREAHFVQNEVFKGQWGDEFVYAMLAEEWRGGGGGSVDRS